MNLLRVIKDYCGAINEGALRANFALVYELMDEILVRVIERMGSKRNVDD